jgi:hypothetical protein
MINPLSFISSNLRKSVFLGLLAWTILLMVISQVINAPLRTSSAPVSIVSFELAFTKTNAQAMVSSWDTRSKLYAAFGLGFDYLFMPSYAFTIALACLLVASRLPGWSAALGAWMAWGVFLAAFLDAVENVGLWQTLLGPIGSTWPAISFWCAIFKFTLILLGIAYGLIGWLFRRKKIN